MQLLTLASAAAAVTGATATPDHPSATARVAFSVGVFLYAVLMAVCVWLLRPVTLITENDPRIIVEDFADRGRGISESLRLLALFHADNLDDNSHKLVRMMRLYMVALALLGGLVVLFALAAVLLR